MKSSFSLGHIGGIEILINYTWFFIFALLTWSLAQGFFPNYLPGWSTPTYWLMGAAAAILLFASVLLHELAHSMVAKSRGIPVKNITLFIFGGVSNIEKEPDSPQIELRMAAVGPVTSLILAGIFWGSFQLLSNQHNPGTALLYYLAAINGLLGLFNLLPGFPLDGGRLLRAFLWRRSGNLIRATITAATVGRYLGWGFIGFGFFELFTGNFLGGIWIAFIGWFLSSSADASRNEITLREHLSGTKVKEIMDTNPDSTDSEISVEGLVHDIIHKHGRRAVPVVKDDSVVGIVTLTDLKGLPQSRWPETTVQEVMTRSPLYSVTADDDLSTALRLMAGHNLNQLLVLRDGHLLGLISRADIVRHLQFREEFSTKSR
jgi:Zn-dependent protease/CBS domain-containing protein